MRNFACAAAALALLAACADMTANTPPTPMSSVVGSSDCTSGQDSKFLNENPSGRPNPYAAQCSGNGY
jgi:hypothetical protein